MIIVVFSQITKLLFFFTLFIEAKPFCPWPQIDHLSQTIDTHSNRRLPTSTTLNSIKNSMLLSLDLHKISLFLSRCVIWFFPLSSFMILRPKKDEDSYKTVVNAKITTFSSTTWTSIVLEKHYLYTLGRHK